MFAGGLSLEAAEAGERARSSGAATSWNRCWCWWTSRWSLRGQQAMGARYRLLEPVRQYARERLEESGEADAFSRRHAEFFLALAEEAAPQLTGALQQEWAQRLETDHDNMRAALSWSLERAPETTLRLVGALARFWEIRTHYQEVVAPQ